MTVRILGRTPTSSALNAARRARELAALADHPVVDVVVIGGGITGAGFALDAASRGLRTVLVERHDLAHGTSRWSSKLVHGGLRYLASGQLGIAHESAAERHLLLTRIAPHLTRVARPGGPAVRARTTGPAARSSPPGTAWATACADSSARRRGARCASADRLAEALRLAPALRAEHLRGAIHGWDGQLIDDARLVVAVARTAAGYGASVLTRVEAVARDGRRRAPARHADGRGVRRVARAR